MGVSFLPIEDFLKGTVCNVSAGTDVEALKDRAGVVHECYKARCGHTDGFFGTARFGAVDRPIAAQVYEGKGRIGPVGEKRGEGCVGAEVVLGETKFLEVGAG